MDYQDLLKKYMRLVLKFENRSFLDLEPSYNKLTEKELSELREIENELIKELDCLAGK